MWNLLLLLCLFYMYLQVVGVLWSHLQIPGLPTLANLEVAKMHTAKTGSDLQLANVHTACELAVRLPVSQTVTPEFRMSRTCVPTRAIQTLPIGPHIAPVTLPLLASHPGLRETYVITHFIQFCQQQNKTQLTFRATGNEEKDYSIHLY